VFLTWLTVIAFLPLALTWLFCRSAWHELRYPWIFVIVALIALYVCTAASAMWTLSVSDPTSEDTDASSNLRPAEPPPIRYGISILIIIAVGCCALWVLRVLFSKH
jgi:hypothetical protein